MAISGPPVMMETMDCRGTINSHAIAVLLAVATAAWGDEPEPLAAQIQQLVSELDSADFYGRESAMRRLRTFVLDDRGGKVASQLDQRSLDPQLSFETHQQLSEILRDLPHADSTPTETLSEAQTSELLSQLCDDRFSVRAIAARRLRRALTNPSNIVPVTLSLKARLNDADMPASTRQELERHHELARREWLLAPVEKCSLPAVADEQITGWINLVAQSVENEAGFLE